MAQFTVYRNPNSGSKSTFPMLLDIQSDLMSDLGTRVVIPLMPAGTLKGKAIKTLTPVLEVEGKLYVVITPQVAAIAKKQLGTRVADVSTHRDKIVAALDLLITGI